MIYRLKYLRLRISYHSIYIYNYQIIKAVFYWSPEQQPHLFPGSPFHPFIRALKLGREGAFLVVSGRLFQMRGARYKKEFIPCLVLLYDGKYNF